MVRRSEGSRVRGLAAPKPRSGEGGSEGLPTEAAQPRRRVRRLGACLVAAAVITAAAAGAVPRGVGRADAAQSALASALVFHAPFDGGADARRAAGDAKLYWAPTWGRRAEAQPGLPPADTALAPGAGRFGDALRFTRRGAPVVFYQGGANTPHAASNWSGTVSFWLSTDPQNELGVGFCDPVQITPRAWNNGAFFVEFEKSKVPGADIPFRLGVYADFPVWNPTKRPFEEIPAAERPLVTVERPPFGAGKWTHIVYTWESFNTGRPDGVARLYLDGVPRGTLSPRVQTFTWDPAEAKIALGLNYIGLFDDLAVFDRALTDADVASLHQLERGVAALHP